jgi:sugar/nucleoside kinase (ribokinase family)
MQTLSELPISVVGLVYFEVHVPAGEPPKPGQERFVPEIPTTLGGAVNTAAVAHALGHPARLYFPSGHGLVAAAIRFGIDQLGLPCTTWPGDSTSALSLVYSTGNERAFISSADYESLRACPELPEAELLREALEDARRRGAKVSVAGSWSPRHLDALPNQQGRAWDLLVLNRDEARRAAGEPDEALERLQGAAKDLIVTAGRDGAIAQIEGQRIRIDGEPARVVDATGAGDAFVGGYLVARAKGRAPEPSLRVAARVAAQQLEMRGGASRNLQALEALGSEL